LKITVFGLGYVGCVSAACFAKEGHQVIGVDVNEEKVNIVNSGKSPIVEPGLEELVQEVVKNGNLKATTNYEEAVQQTDISLICVGTPSGKNGKLNLDYIFRVAEQIGEALKGVDHYHLAVVRSTVLPGTVEKVLKIIQEKTGKHPGKDFGACSNPEFLREGSAIKDFYNPPYTVIGELDRKSGDYLAEIYKTIDAPLIRTDVKVAEMLKYANNYLQGRRGEQPQGNGNFLYGYQIEPVFLLPETWFCIRRLLPAQRCEGHCIPFQRKGFKPAGSVFHYAQQRKTYSKSN